MIWSRLISLRESWSSSSSSYCSSSSSRSDDGTGAGCEGVTAGASGGKTGWTCALAQSRAGQASEQGGRSRARQNEREALAGPGPHVRGGPRAWGRAGKAAGAAQSKHALCRARVGSVERA